MCWCPVLHVVRVGAPQSHTVIEGQRLHWDPGPVTSHLALSSAEKYRVAVAAGPHPGIEMGDFKID